VRICLLIAILLFPSILPGFSVLSHEAIVDAAWDDSIKPVLLKYFPQSTPDDLLKAHAYAYGGCIVQDMGYYPFGSHLFSDMVHYVRSGDFVVNMVKEAQDLNELAFSLGALAHYAADKNGHSIGVNPSVALMFPKLEKEFGRSPSYEDNPTAHVRMEFSFDVLQVARGHYAPKAYHDFIGFEVAKPVLERAFRDTYGLEITDVFKNEDKSLATYRHTVSGLIPEMTRAAWVAKKKDLRQAEPKLARRKFIYNISRSSYEKEWGKAYERPNRKERFLAFLIHILPKIGPLRALAFKVPSPKAEALFMKSFNSTMDDYRKLLSEVRRDTLALPDLNFDTGKPTEAGAYRLADNAYARFLDKLEQKHFQGIHPDVRTNILNFYEHAKAPVATEDKNNDWEKLQKELQDLKNLQLTAGS
jgi:hypothetical protein